MEEKKVKRLFSILLTLSLWISVSAFEEPQSRTFEFTYTVQIPSFPPDAQKVSLWIPLPLTNDYQKVRDLKIRGNWPYRITRDSQGNRVAYFEGAPKDNAQIVITFVVQRFEQINRPNLNADTPPAVKTQPTVQLSRYLKPDRLVPLTGPIKEEALQVAGHLSNPVEQARAIYEHVTKTMRYDKTGTGWGRGDAIYACNIRKGNCTDFHSLIIGMARSLGIPARFTIGFPLPEKIGEGEIPGYHCWAELYLPGYGWVPVDSSEASKHPEKLEYFWGGLDPNRVQFTYGRDLLLNPRQKGEPLNYFIYPYVEVDGKPFSQVQTRFAYRDLNSGPSQFRRSANEKP